MKILVINRGSSSVKCSLYDLETYPKNLVLPVWKQEGGKSSLPQILKTLDQTPDVVGHRIVHGGSKYFQSVIIDPKVKEDLKKYREFAPLHNEEEIEGIELMEKLFPKILQIGVFDTAFHHHLPLFAKVYPGPYRWYEEGIVRYGFHGISYQYCTKRASQMIKAKKVVICHLGSGASLAALKEGVSCDTTMGFTPLEGLMMDTRSGTIDPGILLHLLKKKTLEELTRELYQESGLLGLSCVSDDMREVIKSNTPKAKLALDVYVHRVSSMIGSMVVSLGGIEALVFTAGIGENSPLVRTRVCENLSFLGVKIEEGINQRVKEDTIISSDNAKVKVLVIHTQEAFEIARECYLMTDKDAENRSSFGRC